jgi:hypothetical protein
LFGRSSTERLGQRLLNLDEINIAAAKTIFQQRYFLARLRSSELTAFRTCTQSRRTQVGGRSPLAASTTSRWSITAPLLQVKSSRNQSPLNCERVWNNHDCAVLPSPY